MKNLKLISYLMTSLVFICISMAHGQDVESLESKLLESEGEEKIKVLHELSRFYRNISVDSTIFFDQQAISLAKSLDNDSLLAYAYTRICPIYLFKGEADSAIVYARLAYEISKRRGDLKTLSSALQLQANAFHHLGEIDTAIVYNQQSLDIYSRLNHVKGMRILNANLSNIYSEKGDYEKALFHALETEKLALKTNLPQDKSSAALLLAKVYAYTDQDQKYKSALQKAKNALNRDSFPRKYANVLTFLAEMYKGEGLIDSAIFCYKENLKINETLGNLVNIANAHANLGTIYQESEQWDKSYTHLQTALQLNKELNEVIGMTYNYYNFGSLFQSQNNRDSTVYYFSKSLEMAQQYEVSQIEEKALEELYLFYEKNEAYEKALDYHKLYTAFLDEVKGTKTQKALAALEAQYETEKKEREIERLELEAIVQTSTTKAFRISLIAAVGFLGVLIFGILYRRKKERDVFALKQEMHEQKQAEMNKELVFKTRQLTSHALHMVQKNRALNEVKSGILAVAKTGNAEQKKALRSLVRGIDFNIQLDEDWKTFKLYFEQTNQNFYTNLSKINNGLTASELKLCSLIKLNMNIKETASVLNLAPTSVKTARHRLRKKLNLEQGEDLTSFIREVA